MLKIESEAEVIAHEFILLSMDLTWIIKGYSGAVIETCRKLGFDVDQRGIVASFAALSKVKAPLGLYLSGAITVVSKERTQWALHVSRKPNDSPPSNIRLLSESVGDVTECLQKLAGSGLVPESTAAHIFARFFLIKGKKLKIPKRRMARGWLERLEFVGETLKFSVREKESSLKSIELQFPKGTTQFVKGELRRPITMGVELIDELCEQLGREFNEHLSPKETKP